MYFKKLEQMEELYDNKEEIVNKAMENTTGEDDPTFLQTEGDKLKKKEQLKNKKKEQLKNNKKSSNKGK